MSTDSGLDKFYGVMHAISFVIMGLAALTAVPTGLVWLFDWLSHDSKTTIAPEWGIVLLVSIGVGVVAFMGWLVSDDMTTGSTPKKPKTKSSDQ